MGLYDRVYSQARTDSPREIRLEREFLCGGPCNDFVVMHTDRDGDDIVQRCTICGHETRWRKVSAFGSLPSGVTDYDLLVIYFSVEAVAEMLVRAK